MPDSAKQHIGIIGGSFDPVHNGHLGLARAARDTFKLDRVLFVPAGIPPHKQSQTLTPAHHRLEMLRLALGGEVGFEVSEVELERGGVSYTIDTLDALQARWPDAEWSLIMGADTFLDIETWKQFERVLAVCNLLVASRPGVPLDGMFEDIEALFSKLPYTYKPSYPDAFKKVYTCAETGRTITLFAIPPQAVSSTEIRDALQRGKPVKKMLPPDVEGYIMAHRLYQAHPHPMS